jgi:hypothetical protein
LACALLAALALACLMAAGVLAAALGSQVRISQAGPDGNPAFDGLAPAIAYNSRTNQHLVVWESDDVVDEEFEIYGRLMDAAGAPLGGDFRISQVGGDGNPSFDAFRPAVAYNPQSNEFLVVWHGNATQDNEFEIYGQRLDAAGAEVGANDFRVSDTGMDARGAFDASRPSVVHNSRTNDFLVVWYGDETVDNEFEIYGQLLSAAGTQVGPNDFRISDVGPDFDASFDAFKPVAAFNPQTNEYLVVWYGDDAVNDELEIQGQRLAATGAEVGPNDFRISDMGPNGNLAYAAQRPSVTYNPRALEYLVVWDGDDDTAPSVDNEAEIHGQRLIATGAEVGPNDFRISDAGPDGDSRFDAVRPVVSSDENNGYLVAWYANERPRNKFEVYGQHLNGAAAPIGDNDFIVSKLGGTLGNASLDAQFPGLAYGTRNSEYFAVWSEDGSPPLADDEFEIFGRRLEGGAAATGTGPGGRSRKPTLTLRYKKRQRLLKKRAVIVYATADQRVALAGKARLVRIRRASRKRLRIRSVRGEMRADRRYKLRFRLSKRVRRAIKAKLVRRKRVSVRVSVKVTASDGRGATARATIRARR